jgi:DNA-directed RNA polymerase specialized sigma24 family protein
MPTQGDESRFDESHCRALARGDRETENLLVAHFSPGVLAYLRARLPSDEFVEDAREETFLRVLRCFRTGNVIDTARLPAFVHSICDNVAREFLRSRHLLPG